MNERIKELVRQCDGYAKNDDGEETKIAVLIGKDVEKFAELIVSECANEIIKQNEDETLDDWDSGYVAGLRSAVAVILEHFGVE